MQQQIIAIRNRLGLHARAAARVVKVAARYRCKVELHCGSRRASARSIVAVMMLAATMGSSVVLVTEGPDEHAAMRAMVDLISGGFGEAA